MASSKRSWQKWILWGLGLGLLLIATLIGLERYGEHYLQQHIPTLADSLGYKLDLKQVDLRLWQGSLQVDSLAASRTPSDPDTTPLVQFSVDVVSINGMHWWQWLWGDTLSVEHITIDQPNFTLTGRAHDFESEQGLFGDKSPSRSLLPLMINRFQINNASARLNHPRDSTEEASVKSLQLVIEELVIDPTSTAERPLSMLQYGALEAEINELYSQTPKNFYDIRLQHAQISSSQSTLILDSLTVTPRYPKYDFAREFGYEIDRVELLIPRLSLTHIDLNALEQDRFHATRLQVQRPRLEIFHDKRMPFSTKSHRPLPHKQLQDLPLILHLDTVSVEQGRITYSEHLPRAEEPGTVVFGDLDASMYNLSNDSTRRSQEAIILEARTSVMDTAPLQVRATLPLHEAEHHVEGALGAMPMQELNAVTEPLGLVSLTTGQIHSLEFDMKLNSRKATGTVWLEYSDLNIQVIKPMKNGDNERNKELLSFIANTFKVKSENKKPLREGTVSFDRDPQKSIVSYWWKALLSGLKSSVGL